MSMTDLTSILPLLVLAAAAVLLIMAIAIRRNHLLMYLLTLFSLTVAFIALFPAARLIPRIIDPLFIIDGMGIFSAGLILAATMVIALLSYGYFEQLESRREEYRSEEHTSELQSLMRISYAVFCL